MRPSIPRLHVITDETLQSQYSHVELARICVDAGADGIQYREKREKSYIEHVQSVTVMLQICDEANAQLIVNDFVNVAKQANVSAVHLGRTDVSIPTARAMLPDDTMIGGTANSLDEALLVSELDVDYLGVGPVFGTSSKSSPAPTLGISTLREICDRVNKPVIAIGNIQLHSVGAVLDSGAHGVAVLSAICCAQDVAKATSDFCDILA
ncbi:MAG: thiamine phosphate synthase [Gammaproteobacteria bacterium]|nr:thiamine phosphate synthase [Gammaproteobacteria bacterium]